MPATVFEPKLDDSKRSLRPVLVATQHLLHMTLTAQEDCSIINQKYENRGSLSLDDISKASEDLMFHVLVSADR